ncbi:MAG: 50S ribosomal protein L15 [bacterium]
MTLTLQTIRAPRGAKKSKKRRGRGNASGHGSFSTRGQKGQRARSGGRSGLQRVALKTLLQKIPKTRGFVSHYPKPTVVNLKDLEKKFNDGELINAKKLISAGLVKPSRDGIKILGSGKLTKKFKIEAEAFSKTALEQIKSVGGEAMVIVQSVNKAVKKSKSKVV